MIFFLTINTSLVFNLISISNRACHNFTIVITKHDTKTIKDNLKITTMLKYNLFDD